MKRSTQKEEIVKVLSENTYGFTGYKEPAIDACAEKILAGFEAAGQKWDRERVVVPEMVTDYATGQGWFLLGELGAVFGEHCAVAARDRINSWERARAAMRDLLNLIPDLKNYGSAAELRAIFEIEEG